MNDQYDFATKMKENREQWNTAGVSNLSILVPDGVKAYMKCVSIMMCAEQLLDRLETHDPALMSAFANRQPRVTVTLEELDSLLALPGASEDTVKRVADLVRLMREKRQSNADGKKAIEQGDELAAYYHMAREYAIAYYIRGAWDLLQLHLSGSVPELKDY
jgi:hypothetical protein